jgi:hypothetical protein
VCIYTVCPSPNFYFHFISLLALFLYCYSHSSAMPAMRAHFDKISEDAYVSVCLCLHVVWFSCIPS